MGDRPKIRKILNFVKICKKKKMQIFTKFLQNFSQKIAKIDLLALHEEISKKKKFPQEIFFRGLVIASSHKATW